MPIDKLILKELLAEITAVEVKAKAECEAYQKMMWNNVETTSTILKTVQLDQLEKFEAVVESLTSAKNHLTEMLAPSLK